MRRIGIILLALLFDIVGMDVVVMVGVDGKAHSITYPFVQYDSPFTEDTRITLSGRIVNLIVVFLSLDYEYLMVEPDLDFQRGSAVS